jgi:ribosomal protein L29
MKYKELTSKSEQELQKDLKQLQEDHRDLRIKLKLGQAEKSHKAVQLRKDIARIQTFLNSTK